MVRQGPLAEARHRLLRISRPPRPVPPPDPPIVESLIDLSPDDRARLLSRLDELSPDQARALLSGVQAEALGRCREDGLFWLRFVRTRDEADHESVKPFPLLPYVRTLWEEIHSAPMVAIAKSRQMMASWLLCAYCVWFARFHPHKLVGWQTQKAEDANAMVCLPGVGEGGHAARMQFIERSLPSWLRIPGVQEKEGLLTYPNGSAIVALAGGANQVRGKTFSLIVEDEFAHQEEARGVWKAVAPLVQKATKFIAISTPNGSDNCFSDLYHGIPLAQAESTA